MSRLAVMANFDPEGGIGPHVRRQVAALADAFDDLIIVTTSQLSDTSRAWFASKGRLIERANYGYDFFSYKTGLDLAGDLSRYDEVVICNDTYVGPLRNYDQIMTEMAERPVDFWGFTESLRHARHVQSFFVAFRPWAVASKAFERFWGEMRPVSKRWDVIRRYEIGMSAALYDAGFESSAYFTEAETDTALAQRRVAWWAAHRTFRGKDPSASQIEEWAGECWNPFHALADRALDAGRMPFVKIDTLRYDPYGLDSDKLLTLCEQAFPAEFDGVREFLQSTAHHYPHRTGEVLRSTPDTVQSLRTSVRYSAPWENHV